MKKIMFFDIDGTLVDFKTKKIPENSIKVLKELQKKRFKIGVATGRQNTSNELIFKKFIDLDFYISSNGRYIKIKDQLIYEEPIKKEILEKLIKFSEKYQTSLIFESENELFSHGEINQYCKDYLDKLGIDYPKADENFYLNKNIYQAMIYCDETVENIFKKEFEELEFIRHNGNGIDIVSKGPLKEKGVEIILNYFGLKKEEAIAFGDGLNDVGMFEYIDGAALGVSHPDLLKIAKYHLDNIENDGLAKFIKREYL